MSLGQLSSRGKQNNKLYYYTVYFRSYDNKKSGVFSFVSNRDIETKNELCQFIWDKGTGDNYVKHISVSGIYIDSDGSDKTGFIRNTGTTGAPYYDININYSIYDQTLSIVSTKSYDITQTQFFIEKYVI